MAVWDLDTHETLHLLVHSVEQRCAVTPSLILPVLQLLKEGADPHMPVSSGGSLLHLVRAVTPGWEWVTRGGRGTNCGRQTP